MSVVDAATRAPATLDPATLDPAPLDVTAIDNLPSLLPAESSEDYSAQLLPSLLALGNLDEGVWGRAHATFRAHTQGARL